MQERYIGSMIGGALGDTLGMPVEGWTHAQIKKYIGGIREPISSTDLYAKAYERALIEEDFPQKFTTRVLAKGDYTDDTHLSLTIAKSLLSGGYSLDAAAAEHIEMYKRLTKEDIPEGAWESFGYATRTAIKNLLDGVPPEKSGVMAKTPGNAPTIKMGPVGLFAEATQTWGDGLSYAEKVGKMTHLDSRSIASGVLQAYSVYSLLNNVERKTFLKDAVSVSRFYELQNGWHGQTKLYERLQWVLENKHVKDEKAYEYFNPNFVVTRNYPFTLFMFQKYWNDPLVGLLKTINFGGDADSTGAMFGTLAGALHGKFYPDEWAQNLMGREEIEGLATKIHALSPD